MFWLYLNQRCGSTTAKFAIRSEFTIVGKVFTYGEKENARFMANFTDRSQRNGITYSTIKYNALWIEYFPHTRRFTMFEDILHWISLKLEIRPFKRL